MEYGSNQLLKISSAWGTQYINTTHCDIELGVVTNVSMMGQVFDWCRGRRCGKRFGGLHNH